MAPDPDAGIHLPRHGRLPRALRPPAPPHAERPRVVAAPDKMRGTATAPQVADAVRRVAVSAGWRCSIHPMADGGEGTLDVVGGPNRTTTVTGPLGDPVDAAWRLEARTAVVEMAQASGLDLVGGPEGNDPVAASTYGTGELIANALEQGARRILVGLGGSATTDGGLGALRALHPHYRLRAVELLVLCDVRIPFVDAAPLFAPQKGASPAQVELLRRRLERLADVYLDDHGVDVRGLEGAGAAGGLAGGLAALGGTLIGGFDALADEVGLDESVAGADLVVTAEGFLDEESFEGKVVGGVAEMAESHGVPCVAIVGEVLPDVAERAGGGGSAGESEGLEIVSLVERFGRSRAEGETVACIEQVVAELLAPGGPNGRPGPAGPTPARPMSDRIRHAGQVAWALTGLAVVVVLVVLLGWALRVIWPPLILAGAIVFLLNPIVSGLQRRRVPRALGTGITYLGAAGLVTLAGFLIAPQARDQWDDFADDWPELREEVEDWVDDQARASRREDWPVEIPTSEEIEDAIAGREPGDDSDDTDRNGDGRTTAAERREAASERQERLLETVDTARELGLRAFHVGLIFVIGPIIAFYLLVDLPHIRRAAESLVPENRRDEVLLVARRLNQAIGGYFRGQLAVAAIVGTLVSIGLAIVGLPFWLVVGMIAGVFNLVPMIGPWIGAVPGVIIALTTRDVGTAVWVVAIMAGVQQVDNHFISPVVMQRTVKLHPAAVMLALLAGGTLFGFLGLLLAVPVTAVLKVLLGHLWRTYVLNQPLEVERLAFAAMDAQPAEGVVEDVDDRDPALDRIAHPLPGEELGTIAGTGGEAPQEPLTGPEPVPEPVPEGEVDDEAPPAAGPGPAGTGTPATPAPPETGAGTGERSRVRRLLWRRRRRS